jgi:hypothetical protein
MGRGLVGVKAGSRVLLAVRRHRATAPRVSPGRHQGHDTLVFVVDVSVARGG